MEKFPDFEIRDVEKGWRGPYWAVVYAEATLDDSYPLREAENIEYSSRSRLARIGIETGIVPANSSRHSGGYVLDQAFRSDFSYHDIITGDDRIGAFIAIRNLNRKCGKEGPTIRLKEGDRLGRIFTFDDDEVAIDMCRQAELVEAETVYQKLSNSRGPESILRYCTRNGSHPDIDELFRDHPYESYLAGVMIPVDEYAVPSVEGEVTMDELEGMELDDLLEPAGDPPENPEPGVHYAYADYYPVDDCNLWLTDPETLSPHTSARLIDRDFEGERIALEFVYTPVEASGDQEEVPEEVKERAAEERRFPDRVPAFVIA